MIDLVVERHCEKLDWLNDLSDDLRPYMKVFIYDKPGKSCAPTSADEFPTDLHVSVRELKNVARDGHDQLQHIIEHYDDLGTHVAFVQAGYHWTLGGRGRSRGWKSQAAALNELIPKLTSENRRFQPLVMYTEKGPVQWLDKEDDTDPDEFAQNNVHKFGTGFNDMYMRAKELYAMFFGGTGCDAPPTPFTPGMQYIVHRDSLKRRPLKFWKAFQKLMVTCDPDMGYTFERLTTAVYNSTAEAVDPEQWPTLSFCDRGTDWSGFGNPLKRVKTAKFWRSRWGCEPLSARFLKLQAAGKVVA